MANKNKQDFWQSLTNKYRERTTELERKEQELMLRTEMLQKLFDDRKFETTSISSLPIQSTQGQKVAKIGQACKCTSEQESHKTNFFRNLIKALLNRVYSNQENEAQEIGDTQAGTQEISTLATRLRHQSATGECDCIPPVDQQESQISVRPETAPNTSNDKFDVFSLKSEDLIYIDNLQKLLNEQKDLDRHIKELEQKEHVYREFLKEQKNVDKNPQLSESNWANKKSTNFDENKQVCELRLENLLLKDELKDLKADIRQNLERIEGPMQFKVETERYKCIKLEEQLEQQTKQFLQQQQSDLNEINTLRMELSSANANLFKLNQSNQETNQMKQQLETKIQQLEDDLVRQKLSDFETIKHLSEALEQSNQSAQATQTREPCNLHEITRELSQTLKETGPCGELSTLPPDIKTTAEYVKELAVLVDNKLPQRPTTTAPVNVLPIVVPPPPPVQTPQTNRQEENITPFVRNRTPPCICVTGPPNNDEVVIVMPTNENITSQSSRSLNQVGSATNVPEQQPTFIPCQCNEIQQSVSQTRTAERPPQLPPIPETQVEILDQPCENVDVMAIITRSGHLEVISKGPDGVVEGAIQKNPSGSIQFTAEIKLGPQVNKRESITRCLQAAEQIENQEINVNQIEEVSNENNQ